MNDEIDKIRSILFIWPAYMLDFHNLVMKKHSTYFQTIEEQGILIIRRFLETNHDFFYVYISFSFEFMTGSYFCMHRIFLKCITELFEEKFWFMVFLGFTCYLY